MILDCFMFNNEFDVLEIRLNELSNHVDKFIISESNTTHSGNSKPLYLKKALENGAFQEFKNKIVLVESNISLYGGSWDKENAQRNSLMEPCKEYNDTDIILISDCDEIPSTRFIEDAKKYLLDNKAQYVLSKQIFYYYSFKMHKRYECHGTIALLRSSMKIITFQQLRDMRFSLPHIASSGWHLSFFGGADTVKQKIESFAHTEFAYLNDINKIQTKIENGTDIFDRGVNEDLIPNRYQLPNVVEKNKEKYKKYL